MTRVLLAALSAMSRLGLESLLRDQPDIEIAAAASDLGALTTLVEEHQPDVVVLEWEDASDELPPEVTSLPGAAVLLLADGAPGAELLRSGVRGVLPRDLSGAELGAAVQAVARGLIVHSPSFLDSLFAAPAIATRDQAPPGQALSPREIEVLRMVADGLGNKQIAYRLSISEHTVKFHVASVMGKLRAGSRTEAVTLGIRQGLILV